jgi:threonine/homoserine/homoserine lactone efflux protein
MADLSIYGAPLAFIAAAILIELTPGPNMTYLAVIALADGRRAGYAAVAGVALGLAVVGLLAAFGLATVISESPALYELLRWAGVFYFVWLAFEQWRAADIDGVAIGASANSSLRQYFRRGLISNLLNPKAAVFYIAALPSFVDPAKPILRQTVAMTIAYVVIATAIHALIVTAAAQARPLLASSAQLRTVRRVLALTLLAIAGWLVFATRPPV